MHKAVVVLLAAVGSACALAAVPARAEPLPAIPIAWDSVALDRMVRAIADHRRIAEAGGWPAIPEGRSSMRPAWVDSRVPAVRQRLAASGDMAAAAAASTGETVDPPVVAAVVKFQARHGLLADGIAGRKTVETMNVAAADRAAQLELNYDRLRALNRRLPATGVVVNIPAATVQFVVDGRTVLASRAIVGRRDWATPLIDGMIGEVEINPSWTVPARIARLEILPRIMAEPAYLQANHIRVLGGAGGGGEIPPAQVDWSRFAASGYRLRQDPGPDNPLGAVKFIFPNRHDVYLHDTPSKGLFAREERTLSHGCVRVERALDLAVHVLSSAPGWQADALRAAVAAKRTERVRLPRPVPIHMVYLTAWVSPDGEAQFRPDVYGRDQARAAGKDPGPTPVVACNPRDAAAPPG